MAPRPARQEYRGIQTRVVLTGGRLTGHSWEQFALPWAIARRSTLFSPAGCGPLAHGNQVLTIHDLGPLDTPESYQRAFAFWYSQLIPALARRVRKIVTVSEYCKSRIVESLRVPENKVIVGGEAASSGFFPRPDAEVERTKERFGLDAPYFLCVGAISPRKNLDRLLRAWRGIAEEMEGANLIIVGKEGLRFAGSMSLNLKTNRVIRLSSVGDEDLACLYTGARGLLYPSLYEGFGLPILEAMACGCPVLTSNCTAMPEVSNGAAILVDPVSEASIADGIRGLASEHRRQVLRKSGFARCRDFAWERTANIVTGALLN